MFVIFKASNKDFVLNTHVIIYATTSQFQEVMTLAVKAKLTTIEPNLH